MLSDFDNDDDVDVADDGEAVTAAEVLQTLEEVDPMLIRDCERY